MTLLRVKKWKTNTEIKKRICYTEEGKRGRNQRFVEFYYLLRFARDCSLQEMWTKTLLHTSPIIYQYCSIFTFPFSAKVERDYTCILRFYFLSFPSFFFLKQAMPMITTFSRNLFSIYRFSVHTFLLKYNRPDQHIIKI